MRPVALVGIGCRLPGARGPERYWELLEAGVDAVGEVPADRWDADALYDADPAAPGKMSTRWGGFLDGLDRFDAEFFGISPREAARMDPQQRLMLEVAWEALGDAGIAAGGLAGSRTGVFAGVSTYDHGAVLAVTPGARETYDGTGSALSIVANRLSYLLDLRGPSLVVDTACSSSLVAVHLACHSIEMGESDLVLVGGVNVITSPVVGIGFSKGGLMAPDGRCKPFDHRANGYVRSEGVGVVVLKPLERAIADGDRIYATILGSATNQDGRSNGLVAPNRLAQEAVLRDAYRSAEVDPLEVDYVEAHGTGTAVGDPIEVAALASVLGEGRSTERPLHLGSVKSNIGHLEAAAGVAGLIKTALSLHKRSLLATIHYQRANPMLGLERLPIVIQASNEPWPVTEGETFAGVSAFGFGGSNAHVVLGVAPLRATASQAGEPSPTQLVPISARSEEALRSRALAWAALVEGAPEEPSWLPAAASAAALRDDHHRYRAAVVAADAEALVAGMRAIAADEQAANVAPIRPVARRAPRIALVFPGQGPQWPGMGRGLAASVPAFGAAMARCDREIAPLLGHPLWDAEKGLIAEGVESVQPALFAIQVALAETWRAWGVSPSAVVGQSLGEIAAAHVSGALSLAEGALVVCERSRLLSEISGIGGLLIVELSHEEARELIAGRERELSVAAVNAPRSTVISGPPKLLDELHATLDERGVFSRRVAVEFAAHSPQVEPLQPRLGNALTGLSPVESSTAFYSTVTGELTPGAELGPGYWEENLRAPALLPPALERLLADGHHAFIEVSPHPVLARCISQVAEHVGQEASVVSSLHREEEELGTMLRAFGSLYAAGASVSWSALHPRGAAQVSLPAHGWRQTSFPVGAAIFPQAATTQTPAPRTAREERVGLLRGRIPVATEPGLRLWSLGVDLDRAPEIAEHRLDGQGLVPGAYWLTAATEAARDLLGGDGPVMLERVAFTRPCLATEHADVQLGLRSDREQGIAFTIASAGAEGQSVVHATGELRAASAAESPQQMPLTALTARCARELDVAEEYARLETAGLEYGPRFRALQSLWVGEREAVAKVRLTDGLSASHSSLHPALLDGCLHALGAATGGLSSEPGRVIPVAVERVWAGGGPPLSEAWCHARVLERAGRDLRAEVTVLDGSGSPVWAASGLLVRIGDRRRAPEEGGLYALDWKPVSEEPVAVTAPGTWLILAGEEADAGRALAARLTATGERCTVALAGAPAAATECSLAGRDSESYDHLVAAAARSEPPLRGVIDLRSTAHAAGQDEAKLLYSTSSEALLLAQSLARFPWSAAPPRLWLLTATTQALCSPTASATLAGAPIWGLGRVLASELSELRCSLVDLPRSLGAADLDRLLAALRSERFPHQAILRDGQMLAPGMAALPSSASTAPVLRSERSYLVTGGLGDLGLQIAGWLADRGARHLVLLGRTLPSPAAEAAIASLGDRGIEVTVRHADVAEEDQLRAVLEELGDGLPGLAGVVHAAGVLEDALATNLATDALQRALAGKALGAWNLHRLTLEHPLELFVMFSSLAGIAGSAGQSAYAAANSFLDGLALHRAGLGLPALSIDWGLWAGSRVSEEDGVFERLAARGAPPLAPATALELLDEALCSGRTHVVAAAFDWRRWRGGIGTSAERLLFARLAADGAETGLEPARGGLRDALMRARSHSARSRILRRALIQEIAHVICVPPGQLDSTLPFQELGVDSLTAIELRDRLEAQLDIRLSAALMWAYPTVDDLAQELLGRVEQRAPREDAQGETELVGAAPGGSDGG